MRRIIYREDGGVSVVIPAPKSRRKDETEEQWLERVFDKATPEGLEYKDIDTKDEPLCDRRFRNAWSKGTNGKAIEVDLGKAKTQVFVELRRERDKELVKTDGLMARAIETEMGPIVDIGLFETEADRLKAYRQKLRDLPEISGIDKVALIEDLQAKYPTTEMGIQEYMAIAELEAEK